MKTYMFEHLYLLNICFTKIFSCFNFFCFAFCLTALLAAWPLSDTSKSIEFRSYLVNSVWSVKVKACLEDELVSKSWTIIGLWHTWETANTQTSSITRVLAHGIQYLFISTWPIIFSYFHVRCFVRDCAATRRSNKKETSSREIEL